MAIVLAPRRALDTTGVLGRTGNLSRAALVVMSLQELAYQLLAPPVQFPFEFALAHLPGFVGGEEGFGIREDSIGRCARGRAREIDARDAGSRLWHVESTSLESCRQSHHRSVPLPMEPYHIAIPADPIEVVYGDSIRNDAGHGAHLSYSRQGTQPGHKTDGSRTAASYFSVEDAEAHEDDGKMEFTVRLEPHGLGIVTVDYETADGTGIKAARAGLDYTETSGTLRFHSLKTERTVSVPITDDTHEDDGETFTLTLSNPRGARLRPDDAEATGTIRNSEPLTATFPESVYASASHGGADDRPQAVVAFSEAVAEFGADTPSVSVTGGTVASVQPHAEDGQEHAWIFFLAPDGDGAVTFALVADAACAAGGICTSGGRALTEVPAAATIPGPEETAEIPGPEETAEPALTASFEDMPAEHDGGERVPLPRGVQRRDQHQLHDDARRVVHGDGR